MEPEPVEKTKGTLTIAFGRFNPPTIGHEKLLNQVAASADNEDYIDAWFENQDLNEDLANLKKDIAGKGTDIQNYWIKEKEDEI